jgi:hypothetical protein
MPIGLSGSAAAATRPRGAPQLDARVERVGDISANTAAQMYELYATYYDATSPSLFASDLRDKDYAVVLRDEVGAVAGFSTLSVLGADIDGRHVRAIYSGDTIIDRAHWGTQALAFTWIRFAGTIKAQVPDCPLYWFLIVKGHRTYRYLSAFAIDFFPHWEMPTPPWARAIMDKFARRRFSEAYSADCGIVAFPQSRGHLRPAWATVEPEEAERPDVAFFLRANPGYAYGDELVCLTELSSRNLRPLARRVFERGMRA